MAFETYVTFDLSKREERDEARALLARFIDDPVTGTATDKKKDPVLVAQTFAPEGKIEGVVVAPALSGEDLRKAAGEKAKVLGKEGPAKVKAFVASLSVKSIVDVAPEARAKALADLSALS